MYRPAIVYFRFLCRNFSSGHTPAVASTKANTHNLSDGWSATSEEVAEEVRGDVLEVIEEAQEEAVS